MNADSFSTSDYILYNISQTSGEHWLLSSTKDKHSPYYSPILQFRKSTKTRLWKESQIHSHSLSTEIYFVLEGQMDILVNDKLISIIPNKLLLVNRNVPHLMAGGKSPLSHIVIKVPHQNDERKVHQELTLDHLKKITQTSSTSNLDPKEGFLIDLTAPQNQNCWVLGLGSAIYSTPELSLAYMNLKSIDDYYKTNHKDTNHHHKYIEEWYLTITGSQLIQIDNTKLELTPLKLLRIKQGVQHRLLKYNYPFQGITFRSPALIDDKVIIE